MKMISFKLKSDTSFNIDCWLLKQNTLKDWVSFTFDLENTLNIQTSIIAFLKEATHLYLEGLTDIIVFTLSIYFYKYIFAFFSPLMLPLTNVQSIDFAQSVVWFVFVCGFNQTEGSKYTFD